MKKPHCYKCGSGNVHVVKYHDAVSCVEKKRGCCYSVSSLVRCECGHEWRTVAPWVEAEKTDLFRVLEVEK